MGETRRNSHHLHSEQWLSLSSAVTDIPKCNGKYKTVWRAPSLTWSYQLKNGETRVGKKKCFFGHGNDRWPYLLSWIKSNNSWMTLLASFKIFLCNCSGPQNCRLCKRQWRCRSLQVTIPTSDREIGREGGRRKESRKKKSEEKRDLRVLNTEGNGGEPLDHTREKLWWKVQNY